METINLTTGKAYTLVTKAAFTITQNVDGIDFNVISGDAGTHYFTSIAPTANIDTTGDYACKLLFNNALIINGNGGGSTPSDLTINKVKFLDCTSLPESVALTPDTNYRQYSILANADTQLKITDWENISLPENQSYTADLTLYNFTDTNSIILPETARIMGSIPTLGGDPIGICIRYNSGNTVVPAELVINLNAYTYA